MHVSCVSEVRYNFPTGTVNMMSRQVCKRTNTLIREEYSNSGAVRHAMRTKTRIDSRGSCGQDSAENHIRHRQRGRIVKSTRWRHFMLALRIYWSLPSAAVRMHGHDGASNRAI